MPALLGRLNSAGPEDLCPTLLDALSANGAVAIRLFLADVEERVLNLWDGAGRSAFPETAFIRIDGSEHGLVYQTGRTASAGGGQRTALLAPIVAKGERLGVVEITVPSPSGNDAAQGAATIGLFLGYFITAADQWTDEFHVARRRKDMTLAAEVQWNLLPLAAFTSSRVSLAGAVEPAYDTGGDAFDYACGRARLVAGVFDAMGHGLAAARASALAVAAFRNARRRGEDLHAQARFIHDAMRSRSGWEGFVTGQLLAVDLEDPSSTELINAGHVPPFVQRGTLGPEHPEMLVDQPFGVPFDTALRLQRLELRPGDRLVLLSDGAIEARPDAGEPYGEERLAAKLGEVRHLPPREATRRLIAAVREHCAADLADDVTVMMIDCLVDGPTRASPGSIDRRSAHSRLRSCGPVRRALQLQIPIAGEIPGSLLDPTFRLITFGFHRRLLSVRRWSGVQRSGRPRHTRRTRKTMSRITRTRTTMPGTTTARPSMCSSSPRSRLPSPSLPRFAGRTPRRWRASRSLDSTPPPPFVRWQIPSWTEELPLQVQAVLPCTSANLSTVRQIGRTSPLREWTSCQAGKSGA